MVAICSPDWEWWENLLRSLKVNWEALDLFDAKLRFTGMFQEDVTIENATEVKSFWRS